MDVKLPAKHPITLVPNANDIYNVLEYQEIQFRKLNAAYKKNGWYSVIGAYKEIFKSLSFPFCGFSEDVLNYADAIANSNKVAGFNASTHSDLKQIVQFALKFPYKGDLLSKETFDYLSFLEKPIKTQKIYGDFPQRLYKLFNYVKHSANDYKKRVERVVNEKGKPLSVSHFVGASQKIYDILADIKKSSQLKSKFRRKV